MAEMREIQCQELKGSGTRIVLEIKDFLSLKLDECLKSHTFRAVNRDWKLRFSNNKFVFREFYSLFIEKSTENPPDSSVLIEALLKVRDADFERHEYRAGNRVGYWQFAKFANKSILLEHLKAGSPNNTVQIVCTFRRLENSDIVSSATQTENIDEGINILSDNICNMYRTKESFDLEFKVGPKVFSVSKDFLAAHLFEFSSMLKHEMKKKIAVTIEISDSDANSFEDLMKFLDSGKVENPVSNNFSLYGLAVKYSMKDLQRFCVARILENLNIENVCDVLEFATVHEETQLLENAITFLIENAKQIFATEMMHKFMQKKYILASHIFVKMAERNQLKEEM